MYFLIYLYTYICHVLRAIYTYIFGDHSNDILLDGLYCIHDDFSCHEITNEYLDDDDYLETHECDELFFLADYYIGDSNKLYTYCFKREDGFETFDKDDLLMTPPSKQFLIFVVYIQTQTDTQLIILNHYMKQLIGPLNDFHTSLSSFKNIRQLFPFLLRLCDTDNFESYEHDIKKVDIKIIDGKNRYALHYDSIYDFSFNDVCRVMRV